MHTEIKEVSVRTTEITLSSEEAHALILEGLDLTHGQVTMYPDRIEIICEEIDPLDN